MLALSLLAGIVVGDHVALRAGPERVAAQQAVLWKGDWLEVRGEKAGWLKVWDHRHERGGWVSVKNVKPVEVTEAAAPGLRAVVEFLRDTPGQESLGIAYAGLYLKASPRGAIDARLLISVGAMADRLAARASQQTLATPEAATAEHLEVARSWGIGLATLERSDGVRICYDGSAFHGGLALAPSPADAATAVLALTEPGCEPDGLGVSARVAREEGRLALLSRVDPVRVGGPAGNRLRIRRAEVAAHLAWATARKGDLAGAAARAEEALAMLARVDKEELEAEDAPTLAAAAVAVATVRWAQLPAIDTGLALRVSRRGTGETCVAVADAEPRCTHGQVWTSSLRASADRRAAVIAVAPLPGWLELWMYRRARDGTWLVDVLAPDTEGPDRGYVELAGFSDDGAHAVLVRESRIDGAVRRTFESVTLASLAVDKQAGNLGALGNARAWATAEWRQRTLALR